MSRLKKKKGASGRRIPVEEIDLGAKRGVLPAVMVTCPE